MHARGPSLRPPTALQRALRVLGSVLVLASALAVASGCDSSDSETPAPYEGQRPLDLLRVTQSFTPDMQWVGGRVAAVGVNRGTRAALDSTLVWMRTTADNSIGSYVTIGQQSSQAAVESYGGTFQERLTDGETYTFWIAENAALAAGLDSTQRAAGAFADTTMKMRLVVRGQNGGSSALGVRFQVEREERLTGDQFIITWTPATLVFRQIALRQATTGGFTNLVWWIRTPSDVPPSITSPLALGSNPEGTELVTAFPESGFETDVYTLWATTDAWNSSFSPSAPGYAFFRIQQCNFEAAGCP